MRRYKRGVDASSTGVPVEGASGTGSGSIAGSAGSAGISSTVKKSKKRVAAEKKAAAAKQWVVNLETQIAVLESKLSSGEEAGVLRLEKQLAVKKKRLGDYQKRLSVAEQELKNSKMEVRKPSAAPAPRVSLRSAPASAAFAKEPVVDLDTDQRVYVRQGYFGVLSGPRHDGKKYIATSGLQPCVAVIFHGRLDDQVIGGLVHLDSAYSPDEDRATLAGLVAGSEGGPALEVKIQAELQAERNRVYTCLDAMCVEMKARVKVICCVLKKAVYSS